LQDVFEMQDDVTARVAAAIAPKLDEARREHVTRKPPENWDSYDYYWRGVSQLSLWKIDLTREALESFRKAVALDPAFGRAYSKVAQSIQILADVYGQPITEDERAEALRCAETAIQLAGDDELALASVVFVIGNFAGDYDRGSEIADRALALNPNLSMAWNARGTMNLVLGDQVQALDAFQRVVRLNPMDKITIPYACFGAGAACLLLGRYEESAAWARKTLVLQPNDIRALFILTGATYLAGHEADAIKVAAQIKQHYPNMRSSRLRQAYRVKRPQDMEVVEKTVAFIGLPE